MAQREHVGIVRRTLDAAVPRPVEALAVAVVLAVRLVVLVVVRDEVGEREPVVRGDEVDAQIGPSTPQFHDRLKLSPSRLSSPFASLCLSLYATRSASVNPSCAVTKLMLRSDPRRRSSTTG